MGTTPLPVRLFTSADVCKHMARCCALDERLDHLPIPAQSARIFPVSFSFFPQTQKRSHNCEEKLVSTVQSELSLKLAQKKTKKKNKKKKTRGDRAQQSSQDCFDQLDLLQCFTDNNVKKFCPITYLFMFLIIVTLKSCR